jgi:outer membrane protein assembly factor BamB
MDFDDSGGVRAFVNGIEVARKHLPEGPLKPEENAAVALAENAVLVAGTNREFRRSGEAAKETYCITALALADGKLLWQHSLAAGPVAWGLAVDRRGQVLVTLRDGRVTCFGTL